MIDATDEWLKSLVDRVVLPEARLRPKTISAMEYGTRLHVLLADAVQQAKLSAPGGRNVMSEQSFKSGEDVRYGEAGSYRTDVVLKDGLGRVMAI